MKAGMARRPRRVGSTGQARCPLGACPVVVCRSPSVGCALCVGVVCECLCDAWCMTALPAGWAATSTGFQYNQCTKFALFVPECESVAVTSNSWQHRCVTPCTECVTVCTRTAQAARSEARSACHASLHEYHRTPQPARVTVSVHRSRPPTGHRRAASGDATTTAPPLPDRRATRGVSSRCDPQQLMLAEISTKLRRGRPETTTVHICIL